MPAVLYGHKTPSGQPIAVDEADVRRLLAQGGVGRLVDLDLGEGGRRIALAKDLQFDPVRGEVIHADFHEVSLDEKVQVQVPVQVANEEGRAKDGGIVGLLLRELTVECLPTAIPEAIAVDVSGLAIGDVIHVRDVSAPPGVALLDDPDAPVVNVIAPAKAADEAEAEAGAEGEPQQAAEGASED